MNHNLYINFAVSIQILNCLVIRIHAKWTYRVVLLNVLQYLIRTLNKVFIHSSSLMIQASVCLTSGPRSFCFLILQMLASYRHQNPQQTKVTEAKRVKIKSIINFQSLPISIPFYIQFIHICFYLMNPECESDTLKQQKFSVWFSVCTSQSI